MSVFGTILSYKRFAVHDGNGIRTTLFLKGCPLSCRWCHNPEGISALPELSFLEHKCISCGECADACPVGAHEFTDSHRFFRSKCIGCEACEKVCLGDALTFYGKRISAEDAVAFLIKDKDFYTASGGGVTLSGGEPLMQFDFCAEVFCMLKDHGISTAIDTCGFVTRSAFDAVLPYTDCVLYDIKASNEDVHRTLTGRPNDIIWKNLAYLDKKGVRVEIRIPLVPGANDGEIPAIAERLSAFSCIDVVRILPYHAYAETKYESLGMSYPGKNYSAPSASLMKECCEIISRAGLRVIRPEIKEENI